MSKLVLFDLDGVLLNSKENMRASWSTVRDVFPEITITFEEYFSLIGRPFQDIMNILGIKNGEEVERVYGNASKTNKYLVTPYQGVHKVLQYLVEEGYTLGIVTSKDEHRTRLMLLQAELSEFFDPHLVFSPTTVFRGKPAPDHLLHAMAAANVDPIDTVYVGDAITDAQAAYRAGCNFLFALWGYSTDPIKTADEVGNIFKSNPNVMHHSISSITILVSGVLDILGGSQ